MVSREIPLNTLCRDCFNWSAQAGPTSDKNAACSNCGSTRLARHEELSSLSMAHLDCDAFYASVEKRDNPELADKPVIVGGGKRGVVSAACYVARIYGVRSAMPMFKALKACPDAVVIRPNMKKYSKIGREVRQLMQDTTPAVEPLSIDEAFLDLSGTSRVHGAPPAETLARLAHRIQEEIGVTISVGLSFNKFIAKIASDLDKPRGFSIVGEAEALGFLAALPVSKIWGVGKALNAKLAQDGYLMIADLQKAEESTLVKKYGVMGQRLYHFSRGNDHRRVNPNTEMKSVSAETTFNNDRGSLDQLSPTLWRLAEEVAGRLKHKSIAGRTVTLKLKTHDFKTISRRSTLSAPTQMAEVMYKIGHQLLTKECDGRTFRLLGVGVAELSDDAMADPPDLVDIDLEKRKKVEHAMDAVRAKMGTESIQKGRSIGGRSQRQSPNSRGDITKD